MPRIFPFLMIQVRRFLVCFSRCGAGIVRCVLDLLAPTCQVDAGVVLSRRILRTCGWPSDERVAARFRYPRSVPLRLTQEVLAVASPSNSISRLHHKNFLCDRRPKILLGDEVVGLSGNSTQLNLGRIAGTSARVVSELDCML